MEWVCIPHNPTFGCREWKNGSNSSYNCTPFLHSLLTKGKSTGVIGLLFGLSKIELIYKAKKFKVPPLTI